MAKRDSTQADTAEMTAAAEFAQRLADVREARAMRRKADAMLRRSRAIDAWLAAGAPPDKPPL